MTSSRVLLAKVFEDLVYWLLELFWGLRSLACLGVLCVVTVDAFNSSFLLCRCTSGPWWPPLLGCIRRRCDGERPPERAPESECQNIVYGWIWRIHACTVFVWPNDALCISVLWPARKCQWKSVEIVISGGPNRCILCSVRKTMSDSIFCQATFFLVVTEASYLSSALDSTVTSSLLHCWVPDASLTISFLKTLGVMMSAVLAVWHKNHNCWVQRTGKLAPARCSSRRSDCFIPTKFRQPHESPVKCQCLVLVHNQTVTIRKHAW